MGKDARTIATSRVRGSRSGIRRHLEGWQGGLALVIAAVFVLASVVPWGNAPRDVPLPHFDQTRIDQAEREDDARALAFTPEVQTDLSHGAAGKLFELRALGAQIRSYGRVDHQGDSDAIARERRKISEALALARPLGDEKLLALRAYEMSWFLKELTRWEGTGQESTDLVELGGPFVKMAERNGWMSKGIRQVDMSQSLRRIFFKRRWSELVGLREGAFALSLDEERAFYAYLLHRGFVDPDTPLGESRSAMSERIDRFRLRKVDELARIDTNYPADLGRGVLLYRLGKYEAAAESFRAHLLRHPEGPLALQARSYLKATLGKIAEST